MPTNRKQVLVQLDDELIVALDELAELEGTNRSALLRRGAQAVLRAAQHRAADEELVKAYESEPQDQLIIQALAHQAATTLPAW